MPHFGFGYAPPPGAALGPVSVNGDGDLTPAVHRAGTFWLRNSAGGGRSEVRVGFGRRDDLGVVGDWNGNGTWTPGVLRSGSRWYLKDSLSSGAASVGLRKQTPGTPVVGDWDNRPEASWRGLPVAGSAAGVVHKFAWVLALG